MVLVSNLMSITFLFFSGVIWSDVLLMDEVLPEASLTVSAVQVATFFFNVHYIRANSPCGYLSSLHCPLYYGMIKKLIILLFIQHARVAIKDYISSTFSQLLINISGWYRVLIYTKS